MGGIGKCLRCVQTCGPASALVLALAACKDPSGLYTFLYQSWQINFQACFASPLLHSAAPASSTVPVLAEEVPRVQCMHSAKDADAIEIGVSIDRVGFQYKENSLAKSRSLLSLLKPLSYDYFLFQVGPPLLRLEKKNSPRGWSALLFNRFVSFCENYISNCTDFVPFQISTV